MKIIRVSLLVVALLGSALNAGSALSKEVFGEKYTAQQLKTDVGIKQARVIYYRPVSETYPRVTHIYVDGEFHTALLAGGYSEFCVAPGKHSLGNFFGDEPLYEGKRKQDWQMKLVGGKTYYFRPGDTQNGKPEEVTPSIAERELNGIRRQIHALSRASTVQMCQSDAKKHEYRDYVLAGDILFSFGRYSVADISLAGHRAVVDLLAEIKRDNVHLKSVEVIGYTDPIGSMQSNYLLGQRRADTVMELLKNGGISAEKLKATSGGSSEPLITECTGTKAEIIACYAPNRRVVVRVTSEQG
ncbi:OmpA family protein [Erwinia sp. CPCC 100877]|nr:OmpA family protein [Erwinia sp. CPCC 100877]